MLADFFIKEGQIKVSLLIQKPDPRNSIIGYKFMKQLLVLSGLMSVAVAAQAGPLLTDNFDSYNAGNLVGQGGWKQTASINTTPVQVLSGGPGSSINAIQIGTSGQDIYNTYSSVANSAGNSLYIGFDVNVSAAKATGDYFMHLTSSAGNGSQFYSQLFIKSSSTGFLFGLRDYGSDTINYGTSVLNFNTYYHIVMAVNFISGAKNDTFGVYVNPTDDNIANDPTYASYTWVNSADEPTSLVGINLRQGTSTAAPTLTLDNLTVSQTFSDSATVVPEPTSPALIGAGVGVLVLIQRRRK